ncbi:14125_t:CDS:2, partial [Funneliformis geosporum]
MINTHLHSSCLCLHEEEIVHRDLHSGNILIRHGMIKLADFELVTNQTRVFDVIPYIDPKRFSGQRGNDTVVLLPFYAEVEDYDIYLAIYIAQRKRESIIP